MNEFSNVWFHEFYTEECALSKEKALEFLKLLKTEKKYFVLGGDVYKKTASEYKPTYDNWYFDFASGSKEASIDIAEEYIKNYVNVEDVFFVIVFKKG